MQKMRESKIKNLYAIILIIDCPTLFECVKKLEIRDFSNYVIWITKLWVLKFERFGLTILN